MNKYVLIGIIAVIIIVGAIVYSKVGGRGARCAATGVVRDITITAKKNNWRFLPEEIEARCGDSISATIINEDEYDHGFSIQALGINERMPARGTIKVRFTLKREGDFPFFCSVPCGEGEVEGGKRSHFDMVGKIHVRSLITSE